MLREIYYDMTDCLNDIDKSVMYASQTGLKKAMEQYSKDVDFYTPVLTGATKDSKTLTVGKLKAQVYWDTWYVEYPWWGNASGKPRWNEYTWDKYDKKYLSIIFEEIDTNL